MRIAIQESARSNADFGRAMYAKMFSVPVNKPDESEEDRQNRIIGAVLERISTEHPERSQVMETIRADLDEVKKFVAKSKLVSLNKRMNLRVVPASDFYNWHTFAGLNSAPPLEPQVAADFWVMPISASMPDDKAESLLREYNNYTLKWLVIHEALPGHYIQSERLNALQPIHRHLLASHFPQRSLCRRLGRIYRARNDERRFHARRAQVQIVHA